MSETELNTELFYKELKNDRVDPVKLLLLSNKGIFLSEPLYKYEQIKNHEYVVDISLNNSQFLKIFNEKQYNRLKLLINNRDDNYYTEIPFYELVIFDENFISLLTTDEDIDFLKPYYKYNSNRILYYLCKYNYLSYKMLNLFANYEIPGFEEDTIYILFHNYFFLKENINLPIIKKYINNEILIYHAVGNFGRVKIIIEFIIKTFDCPTYCYFNINRIPLNYPFKLIQKYSNELFESNSIFFMYNEDKMKENKINILFSDNFIKNKSISEYYLRKSKFKFYLSKYCLSQYDIGKVSVLKRRNSNNKSLDNLYENCNMDELWFGNKELFNIDENLNKIEIDYNDSYTDDDNSDADEYDEYNLLISYYEKLCKKFYDLYLTEEILNKILKNPDFIFSIHSEYDSHYIFITLKKFCILASLIYNKAPIILILSLLKLCFFELSAYYEKGKIIVHIRHMDMDMNEEDEANSLNQIMISTLMSTNNLAFNSIFDVEIES